MLQRALVGNTGAHSALEMALLDLAGRASGRRLIDFRSPSRARRTRRADVAARATRPPSRTSPRRKPSRREGFDFFKLKIGVKPLARRDRRRACDPRGAARRDALRRRELRADARGGAPLCRAHARRRSSPFIEQPLAADDLAGLKALARASRTPIGINESIQSLADIAAVKRAAEGVSLKLIQARRIPRGGRRRQAVPQVGLAHQLAAKIAESSIGTAAAVHLACAVPNVDWGVSLTNLYLAEDIVQAPIALRDGMVALPDGPGLGVEVDEAAVARFRVH